MPLATQTVDISLATGLNTRDDEKLLPPTKLLDLQNAVFDKGGSLKKRNGYTDLPQETLAVSPVTISGARMLATRGNELLQADDTKLYSYSESDLSWVDRGELVSFGVDVDTIADSTSAQTNGDMATSDGATIYAWEDSRGGIYYSVYDANNGAQLIAEQQLSAVGSKPRCIGLDSTLLIVFYDSTAADIAVKRLAPADLANTQADVPKYFGFADVAAGGHFDVVSTGSNDAAFVYGSTASGNTAFRVGYIAADGELAGPLEGRPAPILSVALSPDSGAAIAVRASDGDVAVVMGLESSNAVLAVLYSSALVAQGSQSFVGAPVTTIAATWGPDDNCHIFFEVNGGSNPNYIKHASVDDTGTIVDAESVLLRRAEIGSHAFVARGKVWVHALHNSTQQSGYFLVDSTGAVFGSVLRGTANAPLSSPHLPRVSSPATGKYHWLANDKTRLEAADGSTVYTQPGLQHVQYDFESAAAYAKQERDRIHHTGGGILWQYDGIGPTECGFLVYPEGIVATPSNGAGALGSSGNYSYRVYYEWTNAQGQIERSTTAVVVNVTMGASDDTVTLTLPMLTLTHKQGSRGDVSFAIYRTEKDGATYYRVSSLDPSASGANGYAENDPTVDTLTFTDEMSDANLVSKELDYLNTGELDNVAPPALRALAQAQDRLWGVSGENRRRVYYSKLGKPGTAVEFNDGLYMDFPEEVTGLGESTSQLVAFTDKSIYLVRGEGPNNFGFGEYGRPELVTSDVGLTEPRSLVDTPLGWMFKTDKGIRLLDRQLQVHYVGQDVAGYNDQTITDATLLADANQVRFLTDSGRTLVYDYERNIWSTFTRHEGVSATVWRDVYCYVRSDGLVRKEDPTSFKDGQNAVVLGLTTSWIKPGAVQGFARIREVLLLGKYLSEHKLRMDIGYNMRQTYSASVEIDPANFIETATWGDDATWGDGAVWGGSGKTRVYQIRHKPKTQKCWAIRFRFTEVPGNTPGEGLELSVLSLKLGVKSGASRLDANRTI